MEQVARLHFKEDNTYLVAQWTNQVPRLMVCWGHFATGILAERAGDMNRALSGFQVSYPAGW